MHAERVVDDGLARADDRKWHYAVLAALQEFGPASQAALSRRTGIYRSDLVAVINELAGRGLIERAPDPADRRRTSSPSPRTAAATCDSSTNSSPPSRTTCSRH